MSAFFKTRKKLKGILSTHTKLANETKVNDNVIHEMINNLNHGELSIAVVGEINRGKSTFLNALMGTKLFPSRASVCTAGVTVLDYGKKPKAEIIYHNGKTKFFDLPAENPAHTLVDIVTRNNENVQDIKMVRVNFPNHFTGKGIVLVDTPGVNDPDTWREDITYEYLSVADAIIMVLDPVKPISKSETEFLEHKILGKSIANLIFVVNKIDYVNAEDRVVALNRIENILKKYVPNPTIYPVASKPALKAKQTNDEQALNVSGFPEFENGLLEFLAKGRSGLFLKSKIQKGIDHLTEINSSIQQRINALNTEKKSVITKLEKSKLTLKGIEKEKDELKSEIENRQYGFKSELDSVVNIQESYFNSSFENKIRNELNENSLKKLVLNFQKLSIEKVNIEVDNMLKRESDKYSSIQLTLLENVKSSISDIKSDSLTVSNNIIVEKDFYSQSKREPLHWYLVQWVSNGFNWFINNVIDLGPIENSGYIEERKLKHNQGAVDSVRDFISNLFHKNKIISRDISNALLKEVIKPVTQKISNQRELIDQINKDLNQTLENQQTTRDFLAEKGNDSKKLNQQYKELMNAVENL